MAKSSADSGGGKNPKPLLPNFGLNPIKVGVPESLKAPAPKPGDKNFIGPVAPKQPTKSPVSADAAERKANAASSLAKANDAAAALRKLTGGQTLTAAEKKILNIGGKPATASKSSGTKAAPKTPVSNTKSKKPAVQPQKPQTKLPADSSGEGNGVSATPSAPASTSSYSPPTAKAATPDLIQLNEEAFPVEMMTDLLFEDIGGTELLNFARHDLVNGIDIKYHQISNLDKIETIYGAAKLISLQETSEHIFSKFPLKRYQYVPNKTDDPSGFNNPVYLDSDGNLVIELENLTNSNQIEIEFQAADTNDIIY